GGHLAGLAAMAPDLDAVRPEGFYPDADPSVDAFVGNAGVYDFTAEGYGNAALIRQFMGGSRSAHPERYEQASPITHVDADAPPALLCHGTADRIVPFEQSERFAGALGDVGVPVERLTIEGAGHLFYTADRRLDAIAGAQIGFLDDVLK
ncbi:prolyl oligopeptidase family serine peptidase, partial [Natronoarchaeum mannanilyticum]